MLILTSAVASCVSTSSFASLVPITVGITSSVVEAKSCAISPGTKKNNSIIKKKKKKHDKMVLIGKDKLNTIKVLISKVVIDSYISHDEFGLVNNVLREFYEMKEKIKHPEISMEYKKMETYCVSC